MEKEINLSALKNPWFYVSVIAGIVIVILVYSMLNDSTGTDINNEKGEQFQLPPQDAKVRADVDDDAVEGDENAPITIVEFSDYECPFCARFYSQTLPQIREQYIETGKVKLIYRDFPLGFHAQAQKAAEAAECAGDLGGDEKYYEMHDLLFEKGVSGGVTSFKQYAQEIGLNSKEFNECLDSGKMASEVQNDFRDGQQLGVQGTPSFFINGQPLVGAQPFGAFQQIIEQELSK